MSLSQDTLPRLSEAFTGVPETPAALRAFAGRRRLRRLLRIFVILADVAAISVAFMIGNAFRFSDPFNVEGFNLLWVVLPIYLVIALNNHAFEIEHLVQSRLGAWRALLSLAVTVGCVSLAVFFLKVSNDFSRAVFGTGALFSAALLPVGRNTLGMLSRSLFGTSTLCEVVIEDGVAAPESAGAVILNAQRERLAIDLKDPSSLDRLGRLLVDVDRVVIACPPERRSLWAMALKGADVSAEVWAPDFDELGALGLSRRSGFSTIIVATGPLRITDRVLKRILDLVIVIAAMPVILPVMAVIALAVKLDSPGPVFFSQERVGLGNRLFRLHKFRSMYVDQLDGQGHISTERKDRRVTRVGRFIRATSLDELPQVLNVLSGAMSIVGPRPHALGSRADNQLFWDIDLAYWHRHAVKPGLTGLAQVRGFRGATVKRSDLEQRLQADLEYLAGWSLSRDIAIIFATFKVLMHRNAF